MEGKSNLKRGLLIADAAAKQVRAAAASIASRNLTQPTTWVTLNPFSWNNNSNMLFIDQPVGVGFSHGTESVGTSQDAAADMWSFLQIFLKDSRFSKLAANDLAIWTES